jgi:hypothetical protein
VLGAINQDDFMMAIVGGDKSMWRTNVGVYCPASPMANDAGIAVLGAVPGTANAEVAGRAVHPARRVLPAHGVSPVGHRVLKGGFKLFYNVRGAG